MRQNVPCSEVLSIAEIESSFNPKAVGSLGELGLFQTRPEFWGKAPKELEAQIRHGVSAIKQVKRKCSTSIATCWNVGTTKAKSIKTKTGPYRTKFNKYEKKWSRFYDTNKSNFYFAQLYSGISTKSFYKEKRVLCETKRP
jgi:hypothetical protein